MTWSSSMSSGYSSLEEDSEEYFFTARTSFFKKPSGKPTESKNVEKDRERRTQLSREEIRQRVEQYNSLTKDHLKMTLVIVALLNKFTVTDNPAKYALYKRYSREEQVYVCKLAEGEQPLFLRLVAGPDAHTFGFVLREQQTGEVMEEQEQAEVISRRYGNYRRKLQEALRATPGATS
ncbi:hypothetical protein CRUP_003159 [Coryphaenoides rupestris]|nr:hypothetical protein CRUP_003159 [Coryphaenoides rupestris]